VEVKLPSASQLSSDLVDTITNNGKWMLNAMLCGLLDNVAVDGNHVTWNDGEIHRWPIPKWVDKKTMSWKQNNNVLCVEATAHNIVVRP
jgi:hypothetical protein